MAQEHTGVADVVRRANVVISPSVPDRGAIINGLGEGLYEDITNG